MTEEWNEVLTSLTEYGEERFNEGYFKAIRELDRELQPKNALCNAAPDLLAACKEFVRKCESGEARSRKSYEQMKAAIKKAEGK